MRNECELAVIEELERFGIVPKRSEEGKHIKLVWSVPGKQPHTIVVAKSGSDHRAPLNNRAIVRRALREDGAQPATPERRQLIRAFTAPTPRPAAPEGWQERMARLEEQLAAVNELLVELLSKTARRLPAQPPFGSTLGLVLREVRYDEGRLPDDIAKTTGKSRNSVSVSLFKLQERGLVRKLPDRGGWVKVP